MAVADPLSIVIGSDTISLPRVVWADNRSQFRSANGDVRFSLSHQYGRRQRSLIRLDKDKVAPDPFIPAQSRKIGASLYIVFDRPDTGFSNDDMYEMFDGYRDLITASDDAMIEKVLGGEV